MQLVNVGMRWQTQDGKLWHELDAEERIVFNLIFGYLKICKKYNLKP